MRILICAGDVPWIWLIDSLVDSLYFRASVASVCANLAAAKRVIITWLSLGSVRRCFPVRKVHGYHLLRDCKNSFNFYRDGKFFINFYHQNAWIWPMSQSKNIIPRCIPKSAKYIPLYFFAATFIDLPLPTRGWLSAWMFNHIDLWFDSPYFRP